MSLSELPVETSGNDLASERARAIDAFLAQARGLLAAGPGEGHARLQPVADALGAYAAGDVAALDALAVAQPGTVFRQAAWAALRGITPGAPVSYTELAQRAGSPRAVRAAGGACAANLVAVVVPCHRVVGADGTLTGFAGGLDRKRFLLTLEEAPPETAGRLF